MLVLYKAIIKGTLEYSLLFFPKVVFGLTWISLQHNLTNWGQFNGYYSVPGSMGVPLCKHLLQYVEAGFLQCFWKQNSLQYCLLFVVGNANRSKFFSLVSNSIMSRYKRIRVLATPTKVVAGILQYSQQGQFKQSCIWVQSVILNWYFVSNGI